MCWGAPPNPLAGFEGAASWQMRQDETSAWKKGEENGKGRQNGGREGKSTAPSIFHTLAVPLAVSNKINEIN